MKQLFSSLIEFIIVVSLVNLILWILKKHSKRESNLYSLKIAKKSIYIFFIYKFVVVIIDLLLDVNVDFLEIIAEKTLDLIIGEK